MARCYKRCKYNDVGFCKKYNERIHVSYNPAHPGLLLHPLDYLTIYYNDNRHDISNLIKTADQFLKDDKVAQSICEQYSAKGYMTNKQKRYLLFRLLNCGES